MDINAIRRKNLELLKGSRTYDEVAEKSDTTANYLSQVGTEQRDMGGKVARGLEKGHGLPNGWMDSLQEGLTAGNVLSNTEPAPKNLRTVPLISWVIAGTPAAVSDPFPIGAAEGWEETTVSSSPDTYALRVRGDSMVASDGSGFPEGTIIIVDPTREAKNGDYVVVRFQDRDEATFKRLVVDGPNHLLKALNHSYPTITLTGDAALAGVVIESNLRRKFT